MPATLVIKDPRFNFVFCYMDAFIPYTSYVTLSSTIAFTNTVYNAANGWDPGVSDASRGVIGFNFSNTAYTFGDAFVLVTSAGNTTISGYVPDVTPTPTPTVTPTNTITPTVTPTNTVTPTPTPSPAAAAGTQKAIFGYGYNNLTTTNLVSNTGVVATDTAGAGTGRSNLAAAGYGTDKAIFGFGYIHGIATVTNVTNLVSNTGVVSIDQATLTGTARYGLAAAAYGTDKAIFGFGANQSYTNVSMKNLVSNIGVVANDVTGVGTFRSYLRAAGYGTDKAIFGYGSSSIPLSMTNLVSNTGEVANDTTGVGTARWNLAAAGYGTDKAIFGFGSTNTTGSVVTNLSNKVSNTGVVATDTTGVGTARYGLAAAGYGGDKAIFGFGDTGGDVYVSITNLVSNTGTVVLDQAALTGTGRVNSTAAGYSLS